MSRIEEEMIEKAMQAIEAGHTRGRFIREHAPGNATTEEYQDWSDAYTIAMQELERQKS